MSRTLDEAAWRMSQAAGLLILDRMRQIEEHASDPAVRWEMLRGVLRVFARTEPPWPADA